MQRLLFDFLFFSLGGTVGVDCHVYFTGWQTV